MNEQHCGTCGYYVRHYTLGKDKLFAVYCGHCTYSRAKRKQPDAKACENYIPAQPVEGSFVSREYLSKALLQKVLDMELLPEIEDRE